MTPNQLDKLREGVSTTSSPICSMGVAKALKQCLASIIQSGYYAYISDTDTYAGFLSNRTIEFLYNQ